MQRCCQPDVVTKRGAPLLPAARQVGGCGVLTWNGTAALRLHVLAHWHRTCASTLASLLRAQSAGTCTVRMRRRLPLCAQAVAQGSGPLCACGVARPVSPTSAGCAATTAGPPGSCAPACRRSAASCPGRTRGSGPGTLRHFMNTARKFCFWGAPPRNVADFTSMQQAQQRLHSCACAHASETERPVTALLLQRTSHRGQCARVSESPGARLTLHRGGR